MKRPFTHYVLLLFILTLSQLTFAQTTGVTGVIIDSEGNPLPGVSVLRMGSTNGTITTIEGKYSLNNLNEKDTLRFTYVGYMNEKR